MYLYFSIYKKKPGGTRHQELRGGGNPVSVYTAKVCNFESFVSKNNKSVFLEYLNLKISFDPKMHV